MDKARRELYSDTGLTSHMEDYIETIWVLSTQKKVVRVKDIAGSMDIKMPSVTAALNKLRDMELIDYEKYGFIELTEKGKTAARRVYGRHSCLKDFFQRVMQLDPGSADAEACKVEHVLSPEACLRLDKLLAFYISEEQKGGSWTKKLKDIMTGKQ
jgi:DtxR family Mn-dependent transcriptional regulator